VINMYFFKYNGSTYTHSPHYPAPTGWDHENGIPIFGEPLKYILGMTEEEADAAHAEGLLNELRAKRDELIAQTDWVAGEDVPQAIKDKWYPYRQALRDITDHYSSLDEVVWPDKPL
jgi:hypothetical protein